MLISVASQSVCEPQAQAGDGFTCGCVREICVSYMRCRCSEKKNALCALVYARPSWPNAVTDSERQACCESRMEGGDFGERAAKTTPATVLITHVALHHRTHSAILNSSYMDACVHPSIPQHSLFRNGPSYAYHRSQKGQGK